MYAIYVVKKIFAKKIFQFRHQAEYFRTETLTESAAAAYNVLVQAADALFHSKGGCFCQKCSEQTLVDRLLIYTFAAGMQRIKQSRAEILLIVRIYNADIR